MERTTITFSTTEDVKQKLDMIALDENRTLSNLIDTIVKKFIEEHEEKNS